MYMKKKMSTHTDIYTQPDSSHVPSAVVSGDR